MKSKLPDFYISISTFWVSSTLTSSVGKKSLVNCWGQTGLIGLTPAIHDFLLACFMY